MKTSFTSRQDLGLGALRTYNYILYWGEYPYNDETKFRTNKEHSELQLQSHFVLALL